ncbi:MAG: helix-turn-helix domain-containing protein, partial [Pseudomonadota bacterium]
VDEPVVDVAAICARYGLSRATLYRMFADCGGVEALRTRLRLSHAFQVLWEAEPKRGFVRSVSTSLGFKDQAHFTRLFKRSYGIAPAEALGRSAERITNEPSSEFTQANQRRNPLRSPDPLED